MVIDARVGVGRAVPVAVVGDAVATGPAGAVAGRGGSHQHREDEQLGDRDGSDENRDMIRDMTRIDTRTY